LGSVADDVVVEDVVDVVDERRKTAHGTKPSNRHAPPGPLASQAFGTWPESVDVPSLSWHTRLAVAATVLFSGGIKTLQGSHSIGGGAVVVVVVAETVVAGPEHESS
jgi:hypothetical protein